MRITVWRDNEYIKDSHRKYNEYFNKDQKNLQIKPTSLNM